MSNCEVVSITNEDKEEIRAFVHCMLKQWFGLQAAISHGMGGTPQQTSAKVTQMVDTIANMCCKKDTMSEDLSDTLEDLADEYFNTEFEDGSVDEVASGLWKRSQDWLAGNKESVRSFVASKNERVNPFVSSNVKDESEEEMETDADTSTNDIADNSSTSKINTPNKDGWTVPKYSRRRNR